MKKANSHREKNEFLHLDRIQIQTQKKNQGPNFHPPLEIEWNETDNQTLKDMSEIPIQQPETSKTSALASHEKTLSPAFNPNDYFISVLMHQKGMRKFFNVEEVGEEGATQQSLGTYESLVKQAGAQGIGQTSIDRGFDIEAAQHYALLQIYLKTEDSHSENIVIRIDQNHHLIPAPLHFTRWLSQDPNNETMLPRTTCWEKWPALSQPICEPIKNFISETNPELFVEQMKLEFLKGCGPQLTKEQKDIFEIRLYHLKCNMIMVKEAVQEGLSIKQILALIIPIVDDFAFNFVTQGILKGGELWPARKRFASLHTGFRTAWNKAKKESDTALPVFKKQIQKELSAIKELSPETLESTYFGNKGYELRKGLFL